MGDETAENVKKKEAKGSVVFLEDRCKGCTFCVKFCPTDALTMSFKLNRKGYRLPELTNPEQCNGCDLCGMYCPDFAIRGYRFKKMKGGE